MFQHDPINGGVIKDLVRQFSAQQESFNVTAKVFMPYIMEVLEFKVTTGSPLVAHLNIRSSEEDFLGVRSGFKSYNC